MLDRLFNFLKDLPAVGGRPQLPQDDPRVAAAALLFQVLDADGVRTDEEKAKLKALLAETYSVAGAELDALLVAGEEAEMEAVDLYSFTSVLKRHLDHEARKEFVRIMWELVYADGEEHELEDNVVWRVAELLSVEGRDRVALRKEARPGAKAGQA